MFESTGKYVHALFQCHCLLSIQIGLLNQASDRWRPALAWFLEIAFVCLIGMRVYLSAARLLIIIHMK